MLWRGFQKPKRLAVDAESLSETFGKFSAQPFERGFGTTIGNALRRTCSAPSRVLQSQRFASKAYSTSSSRSPAL
jgi:hypothetical protein